MKRLFCAALVVLMLFSGCAAKEHANFYYRRTEYQYDAEDSVIVSERRDITGHDGHLPFLISLYLMGPLEKDYVSPFPSSVKLLTTQTQDNNLTVYLTDCSSLSDAEYTLACTCMALTCLEFTNVNTVTVTSAERTITIDPGMLTLYDSGIPVESTNGG